jgi:membrane-bound lytic murein transglycosylase D
MRQLSDRVAVNTLLARLILLSPLTLAQPAMADLPASGALLPGSDTASTARSPANTLALTADRSLPLSSPTPATLPEDTPASDPEPVAQDLWPRIIAGLRMADMDSPLVSKHVEWYRARPEYVSRMLDRSRRYLYHIVEQVEARGMPMEIALLPMIESAYNPQAYSRSHAAGIWQFIPSTGRNYGLQQDGWYDGRRDVVAATNAALNYLQKLFVDFGSWELALAAYNCGEGCVSRAMQKNAAQGLPTDYQSLPLPTETRHYVPKLLAIKQLVLSPESFGISLNEIPDAPYFSQISFVPNNMDISSAARLANMPVDEFLSLNPAFPRKLIRAEGEISLLLPVEHAEIFQENLGSGTWDSWTPTRVKKGETPAGIARKHDTSVKRLEEHNHFKLRHGKFVSDQTILVPVPAQADGHTAEPSAAAAWVDAIEAPATETPTRARTHTVKRGDTLFFLAKRYKVEISDLKHWNRLKKTALKPGQKLKVSQPTRQAESRSKRESAEQNPPRAGKSLQTTYKVSDGDTFWNIANRFQISIDQLKVLNPRIARAGLQAGQVLDVSLR